jgi:hypothetical protein
LGFRRLDTVKHYSQLGSDALGGFADFHSVIKRARRRLRAMNDEGAVGTKGVSDSQELKHPDLRCAPFFLSENHQLIPTQYGSTYSAILDLRGPCGSGQGFRDATPLALRDRCCKVMHSVFLLRGFFLTGAHHWSKGNTDQQSFR